MMTSLTLAGRTLLPDGALIESTVRVEGDRIAEVRAGADPRADLVTAGWIVPGLIDLQVNGGFGFDLSVDAGSVAALAAKLPATGVTSFLPTLVSAPLESYPGLLRGLEQAARTARGAHILGIHLEGPYLNPQRAGAHNPDYLRAPAVSEIDPWAGSPSVRLVTLAPELPGALNLIAFLRARGIAISAGHSNASYAEAMTAFRAGVSWGTHLFNAMSPFTHREPGLAGALLASDVPCGLIVDGVHAHAAAVKMAWRAKGPRGLTLVTDAMSAMGMPPGRYSLGDRSVIVDTTSARLDDGTLAGSILQMDAAIRNMIDFAGCSLADAIAMASATPARVIGVNDRKGWIAPHFDADLVVLDDSLHVELTVVGGQVLYSRS
jgi:N-acetylglucosamine-6-phosphate deacetylase